MDTQLVRLDAPYNIICGSDGNFALHIATLIVIKEKSERIAQTAPMSETLSVASYPVVIEGGKIGDNFVGYGKGAADGQVWMHTELKDCYVVCPQECKTVSFRILKDIMKYYAKKKMYHMPLRITSAFSWAMTIYGCKIVLSSDENKKKITDFEVCLEFEESNNGNTCMVYANKNSDFYFNEYFLTTLNYLFPYPQILKLSGIWQSYAMTI